VISPESIEQLIRQIIKAKREDRVEKILEDYEAYHKDLSEIEDVNTYVVINYANKQIETAAKINDLVKI
jgi:metal-responsive CopG/Arc/MetJ family transcriptional regulator